MGLQDAILVKIGEGEDYRTTKETSPVVDDGYVTDLAENAVLAGCCRNPNYATDAFKRLTSSDFDLEWRGRAFGVMQKQAQQRKPLTVAALHGFLSPALWDRLAAAATNAKNPHAQDYVRMVLGYSRERKATAAMMSRIALAEAIP